MKQKMLFLTVLFFMLLIASCNRLTENEIPIPNAKISLNISTLSIPVGETETLIAKIEPDNATKQSIIWTSSDESIITVSAEGVITAVSDGYAIILATTKNGLCYAICDVTVYYVDKFTVTTSEQWKAVIQFIRENGNNKNYIIYIEDSFVMPDAYAFRFPEITGLTVDIMGNEDDIPTIEDSILNITSYQTVTIQNIVFKHHSSWSIAKVNNLSVGGKGAVLNMKGNTTVTNSKNNGVIIDEYGTFNMYDGIICDNITYYNGGGVSVYPYATFVMSGGLITRNGAINIDTGGANGGGGVRVHDNGTFIMTGGSISHNNTYARGISVASGTFLMSGGTISNNIVGLGVSGISNVVMSGGIIYGTQSSGAPAEYANYSLAISIDNDSNKTLKYGDGTDILPHLDESRNYTIHTVIGRE